MAHLTLCLLGACEATLDGQLVTGFRTPKARALLVYLAVHAGRAHGREALASLLWPEHPDETARTYLRQAITYLRAVLDEAATVVPVLLMTRGTVQLNPACALDLDIATFRALLAACARHPHRRAVTCSACARRLEQAVGLYRGSFLGTFNLRDSAPFEEWAALIREALHQEAVTALAQLAAYHERRGTYDVVEHLARQQLELDPWREEAHQQLMRALALSGQRSAALEQYERCRSILHVDLGVDPSTETEALYRQIRSEQLVPEVALARAIGLPHSTTSFIGRAADRATLMEHLTSSSSPLVTLVGPPGIGKTRLSLEVAAALAGDFEDGVVFVPLAARREPHLVVQTIAATLQVPEVAGEPLLETLTRALQTRHLLLVLDNFEQVVGAAVDVAHLLQAVPSLTLLVTSRAPLRLTAEVQFAVPPLTLPGENQGDAVEQVRQSEAGRLFVARAQSIMRGLTLTAANARAIASICARLDGLPLAIELAAARVRLLEPEALLARLGQRLQVLTGGARDLPARQQTLRLTIDWSYQLLTPAEQRLFWRLAVFEGGWTLAAAEAVCHGGDLGIEVLDGLQSLVEQSLVQREVGLAGEVRFRPLETIREFALERLDASGEAVELQRRHAAYYLAVAETAQSSVWAGPDAALWLDRLEVEHDNLRAVLQLSVSVPDRTEEFGVRLAAALGQFWKLRGYNDEGQGWIARVLERAQEDDGLSRAHQARALLMAGWLFYDRQAYRQAEASFEESVALSRDLMDTDGGAFALVGRAYCAYSLGDVTSAGKFAEEGVMLARRVRNTLATYHALQAIGFVARAEGDLQRAMACFQECLALAQEAGDRHVTGTALCHMGHVTYANGDARRATDLYLESLHQFHELGYNGGVAQVLLNLGHLAREVGDTCHAAVLYRECLVLGQTHGHPGWIAHALAALAGLKASNRSRRENALQAARLFGVLDALPATLRQPLTPLATPLWQMAYERDQTAARKQLDEVTWLAGRAKGEAMTLEQAIAYALERHELVV